MVLDVTKNKTIKKHNWAMVIVTNRCIGCGACYVACKSEWGVSDSDEAYRTKVFEVEYENSDGKPAVKFLPVLCNHCDNAPCVAVCPTESSFKREEDGVVLVDPALCIGCKACIAACPYNARYYDEEKQTVDKCTFCLPRVQKGLEPACVRTCVAKSRNFGDLNDPESTVSKILREATSVRRLKEHDGLGPNVYYVTMNN